MSDTGLETRTRAFNSSQYRKRRRLGHSAGRIVSSGPFCAARLGLRNHCRKPASEGEKAASRFTVRGSTRSGQSFDNRAE